MANTAPAPQNVAYNPFQRAVTRTLNLHTWRGQFLLLMAAIVILALVCTVTAYNAFSDTQKRFKVAAQDSAPSIVAAQDMYQAAQNLEANITDFLLTADSTSPQTVNAHQQAQTAITQNRALFRNGLYRANLNLTDEAEKQALPEISRLYDLYSARIETILYAYQTVGRDAAYKLYFDATISPNAILDGAQDKNQTLLGYIARLEQANRDPLEKANRETDSAITFAQFGVGLLGLALLVALGFTTYLLMQRTHRIVNPLVVPALLIALYFVLNVFGTLGKADSDYKDAMVNAFPSIDAAVQIKVMATNANADESRWIIANDTQKSTDPAIAGQAGKRSVETETSFRAEQQTLETLLAAASNNVTYSGEREKLIMMYQSLNCYRYLDGEIRTIYGGKDMSLVSDIITIRATSNTNSHDVAIIMGLVNANKRGTCPQPAEKAALQGKADPQAAIRLTVGQSDQVYSQFIAAADGLRVINDQHFQQVVAGADDYLAHYAIYSLLVFPLVTLLGVAGVLLRLRDF